MTKQELIEALIEIDSEYLYQDIGYGGFTETGNFVVEGKVVHPTKEELQEMYNKEVGPLLAEARIEFGQ